MTIDDIRINLTKPPHVSTIDIHLSISQSESTYIELKNIISDG